MGDRTKIEWTESTWNPVSGCTKVSPGCAHCYAERLAKRLPVVHAEGKSFSTVLTHPERLAIPLHWRRPRRVFVCSMGDLFHPAVPFEFIACVWAVMLTCRRHTFQVLTKRPSRAAEFFAWIGGALIPREGDGVERHHDRVAVAWRAFLGSAGLWVDWPTALRACGTGPWPAPNVWLGVTAEDQQRADERIPLLLQCPAAVRFVSCEPLLGMIDIDRAMYGDGDSRVGGMNAFGFTDGFGREVMLNWVICGGETGPGARQMHPTWVRSLRDQCREAGVPFLFKSWGEWLPDDQTDPAAFVIKPGHPGAPPGMIGAQVAHLSPGLHAFRVGKRAAGRMLDGVTHDEYPEEQ